MLVMVALNCKSECMIILIPCFGIVVIACFCPGNIGGEEERVVDFRGWLSFMVPSPKRCNFTQNHSFCFSVLNCLRLPITKANKALNKVR